MTAWTKVLTLPHADRRLLAAAVWQILRAWVMLRLLPFRSIAASLNQPAVGDPAGAIDVRKVRWAVESAARHLPLSLTCLPQAFAASWLLQARGGRPCLYYGVAKTESGFVAHAWVELDGVPVVGHRVADQFTVLTTFPTRPGDEP